jgi:hypothetical protein
MELTQAQRTDKEVADLAFIKEIRQHTIDDLKGMARPEVSAKLRQEKFFEYWKDEISRLKAIGGPMANIAQARFTEIKALRIKYNALKYERSGVQFNILETFGDTPPEGGGVDSVIVWCLCKIYQLLKRKDETNHF